jgi:hypothetical protein
VTGNRLDRLIRRGWKDVFTFQIWNPFTAFPETWCAHCLLPAEDTFFSLLFSEGRIYNFGGSGANTILRHVSVTINWGYGIPSCSSYLLLITLIIRDFRQGDASVKPVESTSVLRRPWGDQPGRCPLRSSPEPSCYQYHKYVALIISEVVAPVPQIMHMAHEIIVPHKKGAGWTWFYLMPACKYLVNGFKSGKNNYSDILKFKAIVSMVFTLMNESHCIKTAH